MLCYTVTHGLYCDLALIPACVPVGSVTELGNCMYRGARTYIPGETGDFLLLCSTCSAITHMSDDVWPRFINEAHCIIQDRHCFIVENTSRWSQHRSTLTGAVMSGGGAGAPCPHGHIVSPPHTLFIAQLYFINIMYSWVEW